jgi:uncharacterized protein YjiS (DUF1127 family)
MATQILNIYAGQARRGEARGFLAGLVQRLQTRGRTYARYVRTRDELVDLSDRELADIGLVRGDIERIARQAALDV